MLQFILDTLLNSIWDSIKLLPFLFLTYLLMEYLEHRAGKRMQGLVRSSGRLGPLFGGILGAVPQCGFSAAASNLYAGRLITMGTLLSVFLSTSDEMLPILISERVSAVTILRILGTKVIIGIVAGFIIDAIIVAVRHGGSREPDIGHLCEKHHCHCENGIWRSALHHTLEIFLYILVISIVLDFIIGALGTDILGRLFLDRPVIGELIAGIIGLIPNCASSVVLTELYVDGLLGAGGMLAGLLCNAGVGVLVLLRVNDRRKENAGIIGLLYGISVVAGLVVTGFGVVF